MTLRFKKILALFILLVAPALVVAMMISQPVMLSDQPTNSGEVSTDALRTHVIQLSEKLPRRSDDTDKLDFTARYIKQQLNQYGDAKSHVYEVWGIPYQNVSIIFGPKSQQRIVIGAHYDSFGGLPGADDNASGVAGLLELAKLLYKASLKIPVQLIAYTLEEPPYFRSHDMGSAVHARQLKKDKIDVVAMFSLEMIGFFSDLPNSQDYPAPLMSLLYPSTGNYIAVVSSFSEIQLVRRVKSSMQSAMTVPVFSINAPAIVPGIDFSDHLSFWNEGYPAVMITDTAFFRNKAYHTPEDRWERLNYEKMAEVVKGVYAAALALSN